jgi:P27 family predicted phage terminase small subunit
VRGHRGEMSALNQRFEETGDEQKNALNGESALKKTPPERLSKEARSLWQRLVDEYSIEDAGGLCLLERGLEAFDRMRQAQNLIKKHGAVQKDRFGQLRPNPATVIERDSRAAMLAALKALNLDLEPLRDGPGRPPGR